MRWTAEEAPGLDYPDGYRAAVRDVQALLSARYAAAAIWFGPVTMHWCALAHDPRGGPRPRPAVARPLAAAMAG